MMKQGRQVEFKMQRLQNHRVTNSNFLYCVTGLTQQHSGRSSPGEPRLEKIWLLPTHCGSDKAEGQHVMEGCGPAEQPLRAGSTQDFSGANEHLL